MLGEDVDLIVVGEDEEDLAGLDEGAVDDVFVLPLDGGVVEEKSVFVVGY